MEKFSTKEAMGKLEGISEKEAKGLIEVTKVLREVLVPLIHKYPMGAGALIPTMIDELAEVLKTDPVELAQDIADMVAAVNKDLGRMYP